MARNRQNKIAQARGIESHEYALRYENIVKHFLCHAANNAKSPRGLILRPYMPKEGFLLPAKDGKDASKQVTGFLGYVVIEILTHACPIDVQVPRIIIREISSHEHLGLLQKAPAPLCLEDWQQEVCRRIRDEALQKFNIPLDHLRPPGDDFFEVSL